MSFFLLLFLLLHLYLANPLVHGGKEGDRERLSLEEVKGEIWSSLGALGAQDDRISKGYIGSSQVYIDINHEVPLASDDVFVICIKVKQIDNGNVGSEDDHDCHQCLQRQLIIDFSRVPGDYIISVHAFVPDTSQFIALTATTSSTSSTSSSSSGAVTRLKKTFAPIDNIVYVIPEILGEHGMPLQIAIDGEELPAGSVGFRCLGRASRLVRVVPSFDKLLLLGGEEEEKDEEKEQGSQNTQRTDVNSAYSVTVVGPMNARQRDLIVSLGSYELTMVIPQSSVGLCREVWARKVICCPIHAHPNPNPKPNHTHAHEQDAKILAACLPPATDMLIVISDSTIDYRLYDDQTGDGGKRSSKGKGRIEADILSKILPRVRRAVVVFTTPVLPLDTLLSNLPLNLVGTASSSSSDGGNGGNSGNDGRDGNRLHALTTLEAAGRPKEYEDILVLRRDWNQDHLFYSTAIPVTDPLRTLRQSSAEFHFRYGANSAILQNVCMFNSTAFVLFNDRHNGKGEGEGKGEDDDLPTNEPLNQPLIHPTVRRHLSRTYSGMSGLDARVSGYVFTEMDINDADPALAFYMIPGVSAFISASVPGNIFHGAQVLTMLAHAKLNADQYPWVNSIDRIIAATQRRVELPWIRGLSAAVANLVGTGTGSSGSNSSRTTNIMPFLHEADDFELQLERAAAKQSVLCFEKVAIAGAQELSTPFFPTPAEGRLFREHMYDYLGLTLASSLTGSDKGKEQGQEKERENENGGTGTGSGSDSSRGRGKGRGPNHPLRITILYRTMREGRAILNLDLLTDRIRAMGIADNAWLDSHVMLFDSLSLREQVAVMKDTDVFIAPHGSGVQNLMFLEEHSAVIEIFTSTWYEAGYQSTALGMGIHYYVVPHTNINDMYDCEVRVSCFEESLYIKRRSLECVPIRYCNAHINVDAFEVALWQASQAVRLTKRDLLHWRHESKATCCPTSNENKDKASTNGGYHGLREISDVGEEEVCGDACFYERGYRVLME